jgi:hypothetical protein
MDTSEYGEGTKEAIVDPEARKECGSVVPSLDA